MKSQSVLITGILELFFFLLSGETATPAMVTSPSTTPPAAHVTTAANMAEQLHASTPSLRKCSCCLTSREPCTKTINIWGIMPAEDAMELMPIVYLARQEIMDTRQLPQGWDINISFLNNSNGSSSRASALAYDTYMKSTQICLPKLTGSYCGEETTDARGSETLVSAGGECSDGSAAPVTVVGVFLVTRDYEAPKVASLATRWQIAVLSPGATSSMMADPKYSSLYRLRGDSSQVGNSVTHMAAQWNWRTAYLVYEENNDFHKCKAVMQSIKNKLCDAQGASNNNCKIKFKMYELQEDSKDQQIQKDKKNKETKSLNAKEFLESITEKNRIVFTCFIDGCSLAEFYEQANKYDENVYAFINLDLVSSDTTENRPWTGEGKVNKAFTPRLVITSRNPPEELSTKMTTILSDTDQTELQDMCKTLIGESDLSKPPAKNCDPGIRRLASQISSPILKAQNHALNKSECDPLVKNLRVHPSAASVYDGVWFFVEAFNRALKDFNGSQNFSEAVLSKLNTFYTSKLRNQNYSVTNRTLPDDLVLMYLNSSSLKYEEAGSFQIHDNITNVTFKDNGIYAPPPDEPECGFENERCKSVVEKAIIGLACFLGTLAACLAVLLGLNLHSQMQKERVWLIPTGEMDPSAVKMARERSNDDRESTTDWKTAVCDYKGEKVYVKCSTKKITLTDDLKQDLQAMKVLKHSNIVRFLGACVESGKIMLVTEFCSRGSLKSLLDRGFHGCEDCIKYPLAMDLISGLSFLHKSDIKVHGNLKMSNCLIDSRLVLKLSGFRLPTLHFDQKSSKAGNSPNSEELSFSQESQALLESVTENDPTQRQDIYDVGFILSKIFSGSGKEPSSGNGMWPSSGKIDEVESSGSEPNRSMSNLVIEDDPEKTKKLAEVIDRCLDDHPENRPPIEHIRRSFKEIFKNKGKSLSLVHDLLSRLEHYANTLEATAEERSKGYLHEKEKWKSLLHRVLPESVANEMIKQRGNDAKINKPQIAKVYEQATVFFSDIVDFAEITAQIQPMEVVNLLNNLYSKFDEAINDMDVYKVETIGDAYVVASGLPPENGTEHAALICSMALDLLKVTRKVEAPHKPGESLQIRIGINSGSCVAGVTGIDKPRYCIFGDTVNTASRMESSGLPMKIHISESTYEILKENYPRFRVEERGYIELKGKGLVKTYWLLEEIDDSIEWSEKKVGPSLPWEQRPTYTAPSFSNESTQKQIKALLNEA